MVKRISILLCLVVFGVTTLSGCAQQMVRRSSSAPLAQVMEPVRDSRQTARKTPLAFPATVASDQALRLAGMENDSPRIRTIAFAIRLLGVMQCATSGGRQKQPACESSN